MNKLALGLGHAVRALGLGKKARVSPFDRARHSYEADARKEFIELKKKGLSIPVFTL